MENHPNLVDDLHSVPYSHSSGSSLVPCDENGLESRNGADELKLVLLQLHQVQEELEYYFCLSRKQSEMLSDAISLNSRMAGLLSRVAKY